MSRYYFDLRDPKEFLDQIGQELPDLTAARREVVRLSGEILREMPERLRDGERWTMTVHDAAERDRITVEVTIREEAALPTRKRPA